MPAATWKTSLSPSVFAAVCACLHSCHVYSTDVGRSGKNICRFPSKPWSPVNAALIGFKWWSIQTSIPVFSKTIFGSEHVIVVRELPLAHLHRKAFTNHFASFNLPSSHTQFSPWLTHISSQGTQCIEKSFFKSDLLVNVLVKFEMIVIDVFFDLLLTATKKHTRRQWNCS